MSRSKSVIQRRKSAAQRNRVSKGRSIRLPLGTPISIRIGNNTNTSRLTALEALYLSPRWILSFEELTGEKRVGVKLLCGRRVVAFGELAALGEDEQVGVRITRVRPTEKWLPAVQRGGPR